MRVISCETTYRVRDSVGVRAVLGPVVEILAGRVSGEDGVLRSLRRGRNSLDHHSVLHKVGVRLVGVEQAKKSHQQLDVLLLYVQIAQLDVPVVVPAKGGTL